MTIRRTSNGILDAEMCKKYQQKNLLKRMFLNEVQGSNEHQSEMYMNIHRARSGIADTEIRQKH